MQQSLLNDKSIAASYNAQPAKAIPPSGTNNSGAVASDQAQCGIGCQNTRTGGFGLVANSGPYPYGQGTGPANTGQTQQLSHCTALTDCNFGAAVTSAVGNKP